ncbi:MAG TPA: cyclic pyranopterin monophosphate synthase MoaC [Syntrophomonadaceae bacterium]|nr:cyclic pyranopterin monophosphate synthase MoaC [Syntrophomonadaceae bacterium]
MNLTHLNDQGRAQMVDISTKDDTHRIAIAQGIIQMQPETLATIKTGGIKKGDVLSIAQVAGIMGAKQTAHLIPMCHPLMLTAIDISFSFDEESSSIMAKSIAKTDGKTGIEMEAIMAVSIALTTIYDMCKAIDRWMTISDIKLLEKHGGKSGHVMRPTD